MKRFLTYLLSALLLSVVTCGAVFGQATAQINGAVQDQSGAVLPGVEVTATQTETGIARKTVTNETGSYVLPNLPLGPYKLEAALPGFRTFVQTGIVLEVNANPKINIALQVGQVSEQVEVQANAGVVETRNLSVGDVMETARILDLPLDGRNAQQLLLLGGGTTQVTPAAGQVYPNRLMIASAGRLGPSTDYTLDGIRHVDTYDGFPLPLPFPDALAEFKTEISGVGASQGQGSQVSSVTKSGTNDFHGDAFEFVRNDLFNARPYFAVTRSTLKRNQFGGVIGGPILKNKLFFFGGFQGTTLRQDPANQQAFVPTPAMLAGDFTAVTSPACNAGRQVTLKGSFVNNRINPASFDPIALNFTSRLPQSANPCGLITFGRLSINNEQQTVEKIDYQASAKHSLFGRFMYSHNSAPSPLSFTPNNILNATASTDSVVYSFTFGSTYLISPTTVNAFRLGANRDKSLVVQPPFFDWTDIGSTVYSGGYPHTLGISITGGFTLGGAPAIYVGTLYQISDDVSMTRGKHQFSFGGRLAESRTPMTDQSLLAPTFNFSGGTTGLGMADFLTGAVTSFNQGTTALNTSRMNYRNLYAQDTWQIKPRLTLSYGLRWAPIFPLMDYHRPVPMVWNFDINRFQQGIRSQVFVNAPPGFLYPGDPGFVQHYNNGSKPEADLWNTYWKDLAPHLGLAWDPRGDGKTSVRASYGITYDEYVANYRLGTSSAQSPWGSFFNIASPAGGLKNPWAGVPSGNVFPYNLAKNSPFVSQGDYLPSNPNLTPTYTQAWTLSIQREVAQGTLVTVSYIGTGIRHTQAADMLNPAIYVPGTGDTNGNCFLNGQTAYYKVTPGAACSTTANTQARRKLSFLNPASATEVGRMGIIVNGGNQNYNGMVLGVQRRLSKGVTFNANYTLSHCIGDYTGRSNSGFGTGAAATFQDPNNHHLDRSNCESDQRNNFNLTALGEAPRFTNRILNLVGSGWRLSALYRIGTGGNIIAGNGATGDRTVTLGTPTSSSRTTSGIDICLCDVQNPRPDLILPNAVYVNKSGRPGTQYLNPAAFGTPKLGTLGNMGRVTLVFPATSQFDAALSRVFKLRESQSLEIRAEAFSVLNNFRPGNQTGANTASVVDTNLNSPTFGLIRYALPPRVMQFAMKYVF